MSTIRGIPLHDRIQLLLARGMATRTEAPVRAGSPEDVQAWFRTRTDTDAAADRTWSDLELEDVFASVNRCPSGVGQQVLYDMMRRPLLDRAQLDERAAALDTLTANESMRRDIARTCTRLSTMSSFELHRLLDVSLPGRPAWYLLLPALSVTAVIAILLMLVQPLPGLLLLLATITANVGVQVLYRPRVQHLLPSITAVPTLIGTARRLASITARGLPEYSVGLTDACERLGRVKGFVRLVLSESQGDVISSTVSAYLNLLFLVDVNAFVLTIEHLRRSRESLRTIFTTVGTLDALTAVIAWRETLPAWCAPDFDAAPGTLSARDIYHPLVENPATNDVECTGESMLITGSNMAGKTTYLRAAGACAVLGQSLLTCPASAWRAPPLHVHTMVARGDDMHGGRSFFLVEADLVREMLDATARPQPHLFIIDELYRGTNTIERIAAARAVLEKLNARPHTCLVSTHDAELASLLRGAWQFRHFQESIDENGLSFDYRIRSGAATAGNALRILEFTGYPGEVMENAYSTFEQLVTRGSQ